MITPPPVSDHHWHAARKIKFKYFNPSASDEEVNAVEIDRFQDFTEGYANALVKFAKENNYFYIDLFHDMVDAANSLQSNENTPKYNIYLVDGLHLNENGNLFLFDKIKSLINKQLSHISPLNLLTGNFILFSIKINNCAYQMLI